MRSRREMDPGCHLVNSGAAKQRMQITRNSAAPSTASLLDSSLRAVRLVSLVDRRPLSSSARILSILRSSAVCLILFFMTASPSDPELRS